MTKDINGLVDEVKQNLSYYLDTSVYEPVKEELIGVEHSLGVRKELFKSYIDSELERLKTAMMEHIANGDVTTAVDICREGKILRQEDNRKK
jgi:hypothetical protein